MMATANVLTGHQHTLIDVGSSIFLLLPHSLFSDRNDNGAVCSPYHYHVPHCTYLVGGIIKDYLNRIVIHLRASAKTNKLLALVLIWLTEC